MALGAIVVKYVGNGGAESGAVEANGDSQRPRLYCESALMPMDSLALLCHLRWLCLPRGV